jgi:hypothetical protein
LFVVEGGSRKRARLTVPTSVRLRNRFAVFVQASQYGLLFTVMALCFEPNRTDEPVDNWFAQHFFHELTEFVALVKIDRLKAYFLRMRESLRVGVTFFDRREPPWRSYTCRRSGKIVCPLPATSTRKSFRWKLRLEVILISIRALQSSSCSIRIA